MRDIKSVLKENNFRFNKGLGQNFITDSNLLKAMAKDSGIDGDSCVIEIGAGAGTLTRELSAAAEKVIAYEIDKNLKPVLTETLADCHNVEIRFCDIMKEDLSALESYIGKKYYVVANLPYYITTPVMLKFIENAENLVSMTVMVQKEVAERFSAKPGTAEYGSVTVAVDFCGGAKIIRHVPKEMFYPMPNVDSAIIRLDVKKGVYSVKNRNLFYRLYRCAFGMRRKTLVNNIVSAFPLSRQTAENLLTANGFDKNIRGETLSARDFAVLSDKLDEILGR